MEFYVSLSDTSSHATDGIGGYISQNAVDNSDGFNLQYIPQIRQPDGFPLTNKSGWPRISGFYTATGGESFVTIGNFYPDSTTTIDTVSSSGTWVAYYYIDDVLLIPDSLVSVHNREIPVKEIKIIQTDRSLYILCEEGNSNVKIFNLAGQAIHNSEFSEKTWINLDSTPPGVYVVKVIDSLGRAYNKKIVVDI